MIIRAVIGQHSSPEWSASVAQLDACPTGDQEVVCWYVENLYKSKKNKQSLTNVQFFSVNITRAALAAMFS